LPESKTIWVVDESYLKHIANEVKQLKEQKPKDRAEMRWWMMACAGMIMQHAQSSLFGSINNPALFSGLLTEVDEGTFREMWEEYRKLALHMLKVDEKLTRSIPTTTKEALQAQEQVQVKVHDSNPLVA
jgi:hypothetical protein